MTLNPDVVRARCGDIEDALQNLEKFRAMSAEAFLANRDFVDAACYRLLVAIEAALGLCYHIAAKHLRRVPEEHAECFAVLGDAGIVERELAARLQAMARFRNVLVHLYAKVDRRRVHEIIRDDLPDLRALASAAARLI